MTQLEYLRQRLRHGLRRFGGLLTANAPTQVLAQEAALMLRYSLALWPAEVGLAIGETLAAPVRGFHGLCETCDRELTGERNLQCLDCLNRQQTEFAERYERICNASPDWIKRFIGRVRDGQGPNGEG